MCCLWHPLPPNPHPNHTPNSLRLESCPQLVQAAFCPSFPSSSLHFYCQALLSLGFLCLLSPLSGFCLAKELQEAGAKPHLNFFFQKRHALPPPQVTILDLQM